MLIGYGFTLFLFTKILQLILRLFPVSIDDEEFLLTLLLFNFLYISLFNRTCFTAEACVVPSCFQSFVAIVALLQARNGCYNLKS